MQIRIAVEQDAQQIAQRRTAQRRDDAERARQARERTFAGRVEQPLATEPLLELLEGHLQGAEATRLDLLGVKLQRAADLIDIHPPAHNDLHPVDHAKAQPPGGRTEHHGVDRAAGVLEREIEMVGGGHAGVRNLARHPVLGELHLERLAHDPQELRDGERDAPRRFPQLEFELPSHRDANLPDRTRFGAIRFQRGNQLCGKMIGRPPCWLFSERSSEAERIAEIVVEQMQQSAVAI